VDIVVDGRQRFYDLHTLPLSDPRGCPAGQLLVLHDITVHKEAEARLQCHARELETRNQELDAFARTVAHDLKNPLSVLLSYSQLLTDQADKMSTTQLRVFLDGIARTSEEMAHIVEELLLLARVRRSERIAIAPLCMERITGRAVDRLEQSIVRAGAELIMPEAWPVAVGYAPWVEEVWANYISNAVKYGGRRQAGVAPRIELGAGGHDATPTSHVRFWVRDNGPGLTHAEQARLFVEFTRLADAVQRDEGYGLGLSIVRRIVEKLGGEVGVESEPGQGSTFWFTLPRRAIVTDARP
jgi:signal transduction histidine kinase